MLSSPDSFLLATHVVIINIMGVVPGAPEENVVVCTACCIYVICRVMESSFLVANRDSFGVVFRNQHMGMTVT